MNVRLGALFDGAEKVTILDIDGDILKQTNTNSLLSLREEVITKALSVRVAT